MKTLLQKSGSIAVVYLFGVALVCKILDHCGRKTPKPVGTRAELEAYYRRGVEVAGGQYVGIQECEGLDSLILFNSPKTGSTLAVKESNFTSVAVQNRIEQHESEWGIN
jgi:hypothetical protein